MDLSFGTIEIPSATRPAKPEFIQLSAALAALQAGCRTAAIETRIAMTPHHSDDMIDMLIALFGGGGEWSVTAFALRGSFHREIATRRLPHATHRNMNTAFTLAS